MIVCSLTSEWEAGHGKPCVITVKFWSSTGKILIELYLPIRQVITDLINISVSVSVSERENKQKKNSSIFLEIFIVTMLNPETSDVTDLLFVFA